MKIIELRALKGPNYWSARRKKLIQMRLDIGLYEYHPTNKIPRFSEKALAGMPNLVSHHCSYGIEGGFIRRMNEGTWAGHAIEHFALEMQCMAGIDTGWGRTRSTSELGVYNVVFSYEEEAAGILAAKLAVKTFLDLANGMEDAEFEETVRNRVGQIRKQYLKTKLGPSSASIVDEARKRGIPAIRLDDNSLVQLGYGSRAKRIEATVTSSTNLIATEIACDKAETKKLLASMGIPVAKGLVCSSVEDLPWILEKIGYPLAIKPVDGNHGRAVTTNINNFDEALAAFAEAKKVSHKVIVEKFVTGSDYRALVVNGKLVAVAERQPPTITGTGVHTVSELIEELNSDPRRGEDHENFLTKIKVDATTIGLLTRAGYTLNSILPEGEPLAIKSSANLSSGGQAIDRTDIVHPDNAFMFERIARIIGLDVCGIDVIARDITSPIWQGNGAIIEVNAAPGFRMHLNPSLGEPRNVARHVVEMMFPNPKEASIPIYAITGTNGKTTTTRLIAHTLRIAGFKPGFTTTDGTYIYDKLVEKGDNTGYYSAQLVLQDPIVDVAVLETARGGILKNGLGFEECDAAIVTNISEDHLGLKDINDIHDMARVKSVVPKSAKRNGYAILNADDELVYDMRRDVKSRVALFSMEPGRPEIVNHVRRGGLACVFEGGEIVIKRGAERTAIERIENVPLTFAGKAEFMIQNALAAVAALFSQGVAPDVIRKGLATFNSAISQTPGRINFINMGYYDVLIDYAHNPSGFIALKNFINKLGHKRIIGSFGATGDRRDEDIRTLGELAASMFHRIILKESGEQRGRARGEMNRLLSEGIAKICPELPVEEFDGEEEATYKTLAEAQEGDLLVILATDIQAVVEIALAEKARLGAESIQKLVNVG